jgi:hypothetical protein
MNETEYKGYCTAKDRKNEERTKTEFQFGGLLMVQPRRLNYVLRLRRRISDDFLPESHFKNRTCN